MCTSTMCSFLGIAPSRGLQASVSAYPAAVFVPGAWFITIGAAATHLGLARRALDEARNELRGKADRYTQRPLLEHPATQRSLEAAEGLWFACRAGLREALAAMWESGLRGEPATADMRINARVAAVTAVQRGAEIVRAAYDASGASAVRRAGVLQGKGKCGLWSRVWPTPEVGIAAQYFS